MTGDELETLPSSREEARGRGLDRFFSGIPCKYGHLAPRYVSTTNCVACQAVCNNAEHDIAAKLSFPVHPHMLRHSTGYKLANDGQDTRSLAHYLGHRNLQSTARYTALAPD